MTISNDVYKKPIDYEPSSSEVIYFGMGCFWGAEKLFWNRNGIHVTAVGYSACNTKDPTYKDICYGETYHAEVVKLVYDAYKIDTFKLLKIFWEGHNPTQGMRQGNDIGTQYRSVCYCNDEEELALVKASLDKYQSALSASSLGSITTELKINQKYYLAEEYHQQYLDKNPNGYCGIGGTGCEFRI